MLPIPFIHASQYAFETIESQISINLLVWSHTMPAVFGIIFSIFLYHQTRKLSALYLLLVSLAFAAWSYLDLVTWSGTGAEIMFTWSILDIFSTLFSILAYWFLYTFIKGEDVPVVQKVLTASLLLPVFAYTIFNLNFDTYYNPEALALEANMILFYLSVVQTILLISIVNLGVRVYRKSKEVTVRKKALLGSFGTALFLFTFVIFSLMVNMFLFFGFNDDSNVYNLTVYSLFGMPIMIIFLGYLVAKYQAFDLKLTKSIGMIVLLMGLLFLGIFV